MSNVPHLSLVEAKKLVAKIPRASDAARTFLETALIERRIPKSWIMGLYLRDTIAQALYAFDPPPSTATPVNATKIFELLLHYAFSDTAVKRHGWEFYSYAML